MSKSIYTADQAALQQLLRETRKACGLKQVELALKLGRPQSYVSKYEGGERRLDVLELRQVCRALGVSLVSFVQKLERRIARNS
jgi:transcriptional regulator with XRE-family HTH domain